MRVRITAEIRIEKQNLLPQNPDDAMKKALFEELQKRVKQAQAMERGELKAARVVRINRKAPQCKR
jgi:hypothetical protein